MLHLVPCVVLVMVAVLPGSQSLQCYRCADLAEAFETNGDDDALTKGLGGLFGGLVNAIMPNCKDFDPAQDKYKKECGALTDDSKQQHCIKTIHGEMTMRGCQERDGNVGCVESAGTTLCFCEGELCNGAHAALPGLLVFLPAALAMVRL